MKYLIYMLMLLMGVLTILVTVPLILVWIFNVLIGHVPYNFESWLAALLLLLMWKVQVDYSRE